MNAQLKTGGIVVGPKKATDAAFHAIWEMMDAKTLDAMIPTGNIVPRREGKTLILANKAIISREPLSGFAASRIETMHSPQFQERIRAVLSEHAPVSKVYAATAGNSPELKIDYDSQKNAAEAETAWKGVVTAGTAAEGVAGFLTSLKDWREIRKTPVELHDARLRISLPNEPMHPKLDGQAGNDWLRGQAIILQNRLQKFDRDFRLEAEYGDRPKLIIAHTDPMVLDIFKNAVRQAIGSWKREKPAKRG